MYNIIGRRKTFYVISMAVILVGLISLAVRGLNLGIDFTSGSLIQLEFGDAVTAEAIRNVLSSSAAADLGVSKYQVRMSGDNRIAMITANPIEQSAEARLVDMVSEDVAEARLLSSDKVDPVIGRELVRKAAIALLLASVGILIYVSIRFEPRFAVAGVLALIHDVLVVLTVFSLFQIEINSPFIAAILTVIGYSINATIIVFDRVRENVTRVKTDSASELANLSINQTLLRCVYTSLTTLFTAVAMYVFGATAIRDLTLAFLVGIIAGTYSSVCVASSIWVDLREWTKRRSLATTR